MRQEIEQARLRLYYKIRSYDTDVMEKEIKATTMSKAGGRPKGSQNKIIGV